MTLEEFRYWLLAIGSWWFALNNFQLNLMKVWFLKSCFIKFASFPLKVWSRSFHPFCGVFSSSLKNNDWENRNNCEYHFSSSSNSQVSLSEMMQAALHPDFTIFFVCNLMRLFLKDRLWKQKHEDLGGGRESEERICCMYKRSKVFSIFTKKNVKLD